MDFQDVIRKRRMVRNYSDKPVDPAVIDRLIEAGRKAPSAGFSQGQYLVVVTAAETRQAIADLSGEPEYVDGRVRPMDLESSGAFRCLHQRSRLPPPLSGAGQDRHRGPGNHVDCSVLVG